MPRSLLRTTAYSLITGVLFILFTESVFRLGLKVSKGFHFWQTGQVLRDRYYYETGYVLDSVIRQDDRYFDILILGGSVVADEWHSSVARRLRDTLRAHTGISCIRYWNVANLGHSSGDNLTKYRMLDQHRFDLLVYYEAINETRLNNIPRSDFRPDYRHYRWYDEVALVREHPELRYTVIPFTLDLIGHRLAALIGFRRFIREHPSPDDQQHGNDLKTPPVYAANLEAICALARQRRERLMLANFTYYIPEKWRKSGFAEGHTDYSTCGLWSPIETWGTPQNVEKGILTHRAVMHQVAKRHPEVYYLDMHPRMTKAGRYFCDICHLTEEGCSAFADTLAAYIERSNCIREPLLARK